MTMVHATVEPGARLDLPWDAAYNGLVYVLSGEGTVGDEQVDVRTGNLAVLGAGDFVTVQASGTQESRTPAMDVLVIGGRPIREPVAWAGPFVMNTKAEVIAAFEDFQKGKLGTIPSVHGAPTTPVTTEE
jgi:redox-sensitive bicupin YhaK (pirin superfamily)